MWYPLKRSNSRRGSKSSTSSTLTVDNRGPRYYNNSKDVKIDEENTLPKKPSIFKRVTSGIKNLGKKIFGGIGRAFKRNPNKPKKKGVLDKTQNIVKDVKETMQIFAETMGPSYDENGKEIPSRGADYKLDQMGLMVGHLREIANVVDGWMKPSIDETGQEIITKGTDERLDKVEGIVKDVKETVTGGLDKVEKIGETIQTSVAILGSSVVAGIMGYKSPSLMLLSTLAIIIFMLYYINNSKDKKTL